MLQALALVAHAVIAFSLAIGNEPAHAQERPRLPHVGLLNYAGANDVRAQQFRDALLALGYREGSNFRLTHLWADGHMAQLPRLAAELVSARVDVIIAFGPAVWAAKDATTSIPIVIAFSGDPVGQNVVKRLARPEGNLTGFSYLSTELAEKRLELLSQYLSTTKRVAVLFSVHEPATALELQRIEAVAPQLGATLVRAPVSTADELDQAFSRAIGQGAEAMMVLTHGFATHNAELIIALAARHKMPMLYGWHDFVVDGGLMSYGPDIELLVRQAAGYVDRLLRGEKLASLPVQLPTQFILSINLATAKSLGVTLPEALLLRADRIIE